MAQTIQWLAVEAKEVGIKVGVEGVDVVSFEVKRVERGQVHLSPGLPSAVVLLIAR